MVAIEAAPLRFDPRVGTDQGSSRVFDLVYDGLLERGPDLELHPSLATSYETLDQGLRLRFHLRPGVRFQDGRPFGAEDVAWTLGSLRDGTVASPKSGALAVIRAIRAVDPLTVDLQLAEPAGSLPAELTQGLGILPRGSTVEEIERRPIGTGPFRIVGRSAEAVELDAFSSHWRGAPHLVHVTLREVPDATTRALELLKGSAQLVVNDLPPDAVPALRADPRFRVIEDPAASFGYLAFRCDDPVLRDVRVRRAIALAIDRPKLIRTIWRGLGLLSDTIFPPGLWARDEALGESGALPYDPAAARRLLDAAGYPDPGNGKARLRLVYKTSTNETPRLQAQAIQAMLAEVGIAVEIRTLDFGVLYDDIRRGDFQMFSLTRTSATDPGLLRLILHSASVPPAGQNRGRYSDPELDRLIDQAARLGDPAQRRPLYVRAQEILARDLPYVVLMIKKNVAVAPRQLAGYRNYPGGELCSLRDVRWQR